MRRSFKWALQRRKMFVTSLEGKHRTLNSRKKYCHSDPGAPSGRAFTNPKVQTKHDCVIWKSPLCRASRIYGLFGNWAQHNGCAQKVGREVPGSRQVVLQGADWTVEMSLVDQDIQICIAGHECSQGNLQRGTTETTLHGDNILAAKIPLMNSIVKFQLNAEHAMWFKRRKRTISRYPHCLKARPCVLHATWVTHPELNTRWNVSLINCPRCLEGTRKVKSGLQDSQALRRCRSNPV